MKLKLLFFLNKFFKTPEHPFNLETKGIKTYAEWEYEKAERTINLYSKYINSNIFKDKKILDVGCGAGGKSLYYLSLGAKSVTGIDIVEKYKKDAYKLQSKLGLKNFKFLVGDITNSSIKSNTFDIIIMNDSMEHVSNPQKVLTQLHKLLKPKGILLINFPPYGHPFGAHLSDVIGIPWVHIFFSDKTLIAAYKKLVKKLPNGLDRINFRISKNKEGNEYFSYINKIDIKTFNNIVKQTKFKIKYYKLIPLKKFLTPFIKINALKDYFTKTVVAVLEK